MYQQLGISERVELLAQKAENELKVNLTRLIKYVKLIV